MRTGGTVMAALAALSLANCATYDSADTDVAAAADEAATPTGSPPAPTAPLAKPAQASVQPTAVNDRQTYDRIVGNSGLSLQWISFYGPDRGTLQTELRDGALYLSGRQTNEGQSGSLEINGRVVEVNTDSFIFDGTIAIKGTPDISRTCIKDGRSRFAVTENRKYFRLREFEWCDTLTDYVDIYF